ncbi:Hyphally regulated cell wall protein N-terminal-domain-containing protein [Scheffersomyces xylosifermentans]|uniref:Hyphally regulated cell wall protein N-terminal-domain-containing protein n=1 Tax=Scheffersomyces xylosifermentans TaxID=1304137 RepID=UPI00315CCD3F
MKLASRFRVSLLLLLASAFAEDLVISQNTIESSGDTRIRQNLIVNDGVFYSIDKGMTHNFYNDITINGKFFITNKEVKKGMTTDVIGTTAAIVNNGWIVLDDGNATSAPTYDWYGGSFENNGMVWFAGIGATGGCTFAIQPKKDFNNRGTIILYQYDTRSGGTSHLGLDGKTINNDGTICIYQNIFFQGSIIQGNGCWDVGLDSNFWATNVNTRYISEDQLIYLSTSSSSIRIDNYPPNKPIHIAGWGNNNLIGLNTAIQSFSYDGDNLFIKHGSYTYQIVIGPGYDPSLISIGKADWGSGVGTSSNGGIFYSGPPPQTGRPAKCNECPKPPRAPTDTSDPNESTTMTSSWTGTFTKTETYTDTAGGTDTVVVEVPTNSEITITSTGSDTTRKTINETDTVGGNDAVIVVLPISNNSQTTVTSTWTGIYSTTVTETDTLGGTDTVIVELPSKVKTITSTRTHYTVTSITLTTTTTTTSHTSVPPTTTVTVTHTRGRLLRFFM